MDSFLLNRLFLAISKPQICISFIRRATEHLVIYAVQCVHTRYVLLVRTDPPTFTVLAPGPAGNAPWPSLVAGFGSAEWDSKLTDTSIYLGELLESLFFASSFLAL